MKQLLVVLYFLISNLSIAQPDSVRFYTLEELIDTNPDTIRAITLKKQKLSTLPEALFRFKQLQYLDLEKNEIEDVSRIGEFEHLIYLNLGKNKLQNFPVVVCQLKKLEVLILNRNEFSYIPPCINYCENLMYVDLWETPVTSLPNEMQTIKTLTTIDFSGVRMNPTQQSILKNQFPNVRLILDAPCDCLY